ncbi:peptidase M6 [Kitasatospora sp. MMS16-BH015]|uniref:M6 family metalloprotease domain-containing protein n=1 Tax=Kitasatospora sp. MMS16-BH015 TaxID=2018025 RepID=UPI000CA2DF33|nr:M6 family metalloprotease domain-containing protein [Kitasatospora sp. MMS16-BH015]AUG77081.1 peptidase M6 [Kitasatospora sp. MMS16-BH015]
MRLHPLAATLALVLAAPLVAAAPASAAASPGAAACALPGATGWTDEGHTTDRTQFLDPIGTKHVLTLFVDFPDAPAQGAPQDYYDELAPAADWMRQDSYGRTRLDLTPLRRWLRMPQASNSYGFDRGISFEQHELYVRQAVEAAAPYTDFSRYDLVYVVPTKNASAITFSPTYLYDPTAAGITVKGHRIKWAVTFGQDRYHWGPTVADHETSHTFGLPDLYAFTATDYHRYVGGWDLMGNIAGASPQHLGWERWKFGWIDDRQVACLPTAGKRTVRLNAIERTGGTKIAVLPTGPTTAYVAESRRALGADAKACSTGVLIYRIDTATQTGQGPVQVVNGNPTAVLPTGCTPLDLAAFQPGQSFTDPASGVRIQVRSKGPHDDLVVLSR